MSPSKNSFAPATCACALLLYPTAPDSAIAANIEPFIDLFMGASFQPINASSVGAYRARRQLKRGLHGMISQSDWIGVHMGYAFGRVTAILRRALTGRREFRRAPSPQHPVTQPRYEVRAIQ
jgi:hypothetical protein